MKNLIIPIIFLIFITSCKKEEIYNGPYSWELEISSYYPSTGNTLTNIKWVRCKTEDIEIEIGKLEGCFTPNYSGAVYRCNTVKVISRTDY